MDRQFLGFYEDELRFLRELGDEFSKDYPKIAKRLSLDSSEIKDPYTERLLEGFAFLTARVRMRLDGDFPDFSAAMLNMLSPIFTAPMPSMAILEFKPDLLDSAVTTGSTIGRGTSLRSRPGGIETACEFQLGHDVELRSLLVDEVEYADHDARLQEVFPNRRNLRSLIRIRLRSGNDAILSDMALSTLEFYIAGQDDVPDQILGLISSAVQSLSYTPVGMDGKAITVPSHAIAVSGMSELENLLPQTPRTFSAYRLLKEYFALPARFRFFNVSMLGETIGRDDNSAFDINIGFDRAISGLGSKLSETTFRLYCAPAVNLFRRRADRIPFRPGREDHHVIVDRTRPDDFEVFSVEAVEGIKSSEDDRLAFAPLYASFEHDRQTTVDTFFQTTSSDWRSRNSRKLVYGGTETFVSLADGNGQPPDLDIKQLAVDTVCTNRGLPEMLRSGAEFTMQSGASTVASVTALVGPTQPRRSWVRDRISWKLLNALSVNHLNFDGTPEKNADLLRRMLMLFIDPDDQVTVMMVEGVLQLEAVPITCRLPVPGPASIVRGLEFRLTVRREAFRGVGVIGLALVLREYFARAVTINTVAKLSLYSENQGMIAAWPIQSGTRKII